MAVTVENEACYKQCKTLHSEQDYRFGQHWPDWLLSLFTEFSHFCAITTQLHGAPAARVILAMVESVGRGIVFNGIPRHHEISSDASAREQHTADVTLSHPSLRKTSYAKDGARNIKGRPFQSSLQ